MSQYNTHRSNSNIEQKREQERRRESQEAEAGEVHVDINDEPDLTETSTTTIPQFSLPQESNPNLHDKVKTSNDGQDILHAPPVQLEFKDLCYSVPSKKQNIFSNFQKRKQSKNNQKINILSHVSGYVLPGQTLAIMGPSGSGKTTLLRILSGRLSNKNVTGEIKINGNPINKSSKTATSFVQQSSILLENITVQETIKYSAMLRLPIQRKKAMERVKKIIRELGISHIANNKIGTPGVSRVISGGELKRVAIGTEMVTNPSLILLDEPTSGLDFVTAYQIMKNIIHLVDHGRSIVCTIYRPRSDIFQKFDKLLLLSRGRVAYFGSAKNAVSYFSKIGFECPKLFNPADFFLDLVSGPLPDQKNYHLDKQKSVNNNNNAENIESRETIIDMDNNNNNNNNNNNYSFVSNRSQRSSTDLDQNRSTENQRTRNENIHNRDQNENETTQIEQSMNSENRIEYIINCFAPHLTVATEAPPISQPLTDFTKSKPFHVSHLTQIYWLTVRSFKNIIRNHIALTSRLLLNIALGVIIGLVNLQLGENQAGVQSRLGALFFILLNLVLQSLQGVLQSFLAERSVFLDERNASVYSVFNYFIAKNIAELFPLLIPQLIFITIVYWMIGFRTGMDDFLVFFVISVLTSLVGASIGYFLSATFYLPGLINLAALLVSVLSVLFGGYLVNLDSLPSYLRWISYLSVLRYGFEGLVINEFQGRDLNCDTDGNGAEGTCPFPDGETVIQSLAFDEGSIWRTIGILAGFTVAFRVLAYLSLRLLHRPNM